MSEISSLLKPRHMLVEALDHINQSINFEDGHLELSSHARADELINFMKENFYPDETLCKSTGLIVDDDVTNRLKKSLADNISILLIKKSTNEIVACIAMSIIRNEVSDLSNISNQKLLKIVNFFGHKDWEMDVFKRYGVDTAILIKAIVTHRLIRGQGVASKLMKPAVLFCKELGLNPVCVRGEGTSPFSRRIFEKFGFETIHTVKLDEYKVDGEIVFKNTGDVESVKWYVKKL